MSCAHIVLCCAIYAWYAQVWSKIPRGVPDVEAFKASREDYANKIAPKYYNFIEKRVKESNGPFLLGSELSIADIWM